MVSIVTTATIYTLKPAGMAGSIALIGTLFLVVLLVQKELVSSSSNPLMRRLAEYLNIGIFPLLIAFLLIVIVKVAEVLQ